MWLVRGLTARQQADPGARTTSLRGAGRAGRLRRLHRHLFRPDHRRQRRHHQQRQRPGHHHLDHLNRDPNANTDPYAFLNPEPNPDPDTHARGDGHEDHAHRDQGAPAAGIGRHRDPLATVTPPNAPGTIQFKEGTTNLGKPVPVTGGIAPGPTDNPEQRSALANRGVHPHPPHQFPIINIQHRDIQILKRSGPSPLAETGSSRFRHPGARTSIGEPGSWPIAGIVAQYQMRAPAPCCWSAPASGWRSRRDRGRRAG